MKLSSLSPFLLFVGAACLVGCGLGTLAPSSPVIDEPSAISPPMQGSVWGGHAPLVGAKVYVVSPNQATNYGLVTSLMGSSCTPSSTVQCGSALSLDNSGTSSPTNGFYYVTTDATGSFNLTGDYACTANKAVYIVGVGGSPTFPSASNVFNLSQVVVSNLTGSGNTETATYTFTTTTTENMYIGEQVVLANLSSTGSTDSGDIQYVDQTATVLATNLTTTTFAISGPDSSGGIAAATYTLNSGTATASPNFNPAAVNMAVLGMCPASGTFAGNISYIYMNEISTAAAAYAMAGFGNDAFHIGVNTSGPENTDRPAYVLNGLKQAMNNATLLYDVQGGNVSTTYAGEGHIARAFTAAGNGSGFQSTLDSIGNILASCVDSNNSYGTNVTTGTESLDCTTLFQTATSNGTPVTANGSTTPTDISAAAFNMAHYPAGSSSTSNAYVNALYTLPTGNVPFAPNLTTQPNDWSVKVTFLVPASASAAGTQATTSIINGPQSISVDGGNYIGVADDEALSAAVWVGDFYAQPAKIFADGTPDYTTNAAIAALTTQTATYGPTNLDSDTRSVAFDLSNNSWIPDGLGNYLVELSSTGSKIVVFTGTGGDAVNYGMGSAFDPSGNIYIDNYFGKYMTKLNSSGANVNAAGTASTTPFSSDACLGSNSATDAVDPNGYIYAISNTAGTNPGQLCVISPTTGAEVYESTGFSATSGTSNEDEGPNFFAIAPSNATNTPYAAWAAAPTNTVKQYIYGNSATSLTLTGGGMYYPCTTSIDGAGNIWVGNAGNDSLSVFRNIGSTTSYPANSPTTNAAGTANTGGLNPLGSASNCANTAIDRAGNIWVAYQGSNSPAPTEIFEYIGIAIPTVTPIAYATKNAVLGKRPY